MEVSLNPLIILYRYLVPILNTFARLYRAGAIAPSGRTFYYHMDKDVLWSIVQALAAMGTRYLHLTIQGELDTHL